MPTTNKPQCEELLIDDSIAFVYDGSLEGLLNAIFASYASKTIPGDVLKSDNLQPRLGQTIKHIPSNQDIALRVKKGILKKCGSIVFEALKLVSTSDEPQAGTVSLRFIRHAMIINAPSSCSDCSFVKGCTGRCKRNKRHKVLDDLTHPYVAPFVEINRAVSNECEKMRQFIRFEQLDNGVWFAKCNPKASVVPLIMDWFSKRFNIQPFIIYDEVHDIAGVYEGQNWCLVKTDTIQLPERTQEEQTMQQAWKTFYRTIAVESRYNPELRRQFMPKRFWQNILEMQEDIPCKKESVQPNRLEKQKPLYLETN